MRCRYPGSDTRCNDPGQPHLSWVRHGRSVHDDEPRYLRWLESAQSSECYLFVPKFFQRRHWEPPGVLCEGPNCYGRDKVTARASGLSDRKTTCGDQPLTPVIHLIILPGTTCEETAGSSRIIEEHCPCEACLHLQYA